jgi:predicted RNA methylase
LILNYLENKEIIMSKKQQTGLTRNTIDKFYTNPNFVKQCIILVSKHINITSNDLVIEPSAGNGSFINCIKGLCPNYMFYDLEPEHSEIIKQNYLDFNYNSVYKKDLYRKIHVIGNPPFGRQSSLAIKFIKKSTEYCDSLSFILPKSFKKESMKKYFPLQYHLIFELDTPENSFIVDGKEHNVPCVFQIWEKKDSSRKMIEKIIPEHYKFVKKDEYPDISFRRVGINAGIIDREFITKSVQSHYFIKFVNQLTNEMFEKLSNINFDCKNNTVGPKSISKPELIKEFNKLF